MCHYIVVLCVFRSLVPFYDYLSAGGGSDPECFGEVGIRIAGELHDIGMIGVPQDILGKSDKLSTLEHDLMKRHADEGASILHHLIDFDAVIQAARYHHEQFDGSGYPEGRKGVDIPRTARLIAICDVWDALTTDRPYRDAFEIGEARSILMKGSGTQFDPEILLSFVDSVIEKK